MSGGKTVGGVSSGKVGREYGSVGGGNSPCVCFIATIYTRV